MSLAHFLFIPDAIVISADSLMMMQTDPVSPGQLPTTGLRPLTYAAQKVHLLWGSVGVAHVGEGHVGTLPVETCIRQLEKQKPERGPSVDSIVEPVLAALRATGESQEEPRVCIAGFSGGRTPFYVETTPSQWPWQAQMGPVPVPHERAIGGRRAVEQRILTELAAASPPALERMGIAEAVDYSRHIVRTIIDQTRFSAAVQLVGGEIDTLLLTPKGAKWVRRKED
jgi:hypothetical protein